MSHKIVTVSPINNMGDGGCEWEITSEQEGRIIVTGGFTTTNCKTAEELRAEMQECVGPYYTYIGGRQWEFNPGNVPIEKR